MRLIGENVMPICCEGLYMYKSLAKEGEKIHILVRGRIKFVTWQLKGKFNF